MRKIYGAVGSVVAAVTLILGVAQPASAHTRSEAIQYGCGSGYSLVNNGTRAIKTPSGTTWGYAHLTYNNNNGYNCVVVRKTSFHGNPSRVRAQLTVQGRTGDDDYLNTAQHWVSAKAYARSTCVKYYGWIWNPSRTILASGGRTTWGNCG